MKKSRISSGLLTGILLGILIMAVLPVIHSITYSVPSSDDFWKATIPVGSNVFVSAFEHANWFYMNWYGGWIWEFTEVLLNPLVYFEATSPAYGYYLVVCFACFIGVLALLIRDVFKYVFHTDALNLWLLTYVGVVIAFLNTSVWTEVFYWFCGSTYARAMTLMLLTMDLIVRNYDHYGWGKSVLIAIVGGIACTSYTETIFPGMIFLTYIVIDAIRHKKIDWKKAYPLGVMIVGGLSTVVAPGNQARYAVEQRGIKMSVNDLGPALKRSVYMAVREMLQMIKNPTTILLFVTMMVVGIILFSRNEKMPRLSPGKYVAVFVASGVCLVMTYFPFILGYAGTDYIPNRMLFVFVVYALLLVCLNGIYLGGIVAQKLVTGRLDLSKRGVKVVTAGICAVVLAVVVVSGCWKNTQIYRIVKLEDAIKYSHDVWIGVIEEIEETDAMDVMITRPYFDTQIIKPMGIAESSDSLQCKNMAAYFGKKSLLLTWTY